MSPVGFESALLLALRADRVNPVQALMRLGHRSLFAGTAGVVWFSSVLRQGGYSMRSFLRACLAQYAFYMESVDVTLASTERHGRRDPAAVGAQRSESRATSCE
jgi:hypothetical protein